MNESHQEKLNLKNNAESEERHSPAEENQDNGHQESVKEVSPIIPDSTIRIENNDYKGEEDIPEVKHKDQTSREVELQVLNDDKVAVTSNNMGYQDFLNLFREKKRKVKEYFVSGWLMCKVSYFYCCIKQPTKEEEVLMRTMEALGDTQEITLLTKFARDLTQIKSLILNKDQRKLYCLPSFNIQDNSDNLPKLLEWNADSLKPEPEEQENKKNLSKEEETTLLINNLEMNRRSKKLLKNYVRSFV